MSKTIWIRIAGIQIHKREPKSGPADKNLKWLGLFALLSTFALSATGMGNAQPAKVWKIGVLVSSSQALNAARDEALRQGLRDLGYEEGKNIVMDYRYGEGKTDRLAALARELVEHKVDVIVAGGTSVAVAAKNATSTIPIVVAGAADLVEAGLINSFVYPGGNVTGVNGNQVFTFEKHSDRDTQLTLCRLQLGYGFEWCGIFHHSLPVCRPNSSAKTKPLGDGGQRNFQRRSSATSSGGTLM